MTAKARKPQTANKTTTSDIYLDFEADALAAPFILRLGSATIDYIISIMFPVTFLLIGRSMGEDGSRLLLGGLNDTGWLVAIIISFSNLVILPVLCGQSLGKMITGIRIVDITGMPATYKKLILRQTLGYLLTLITFGIGLFIAALLPKRRALHDYLSGTIVIFGRRVSK